MDAKFASNPEAQKAHGLLKKIGYDLAMQAMRTKLAEEVSDKEDEKIKDKAKAIKADDKSVSDEDKKEFVDAVMSDPEMGEEVKEAMRKEMYKEQMLKGAAYRKVAEELAMDNTPAGEEVDPAFVEAIMELIQEGDINPDAGDVEPGLGAEENAPEDLDISAEDISPEEVAAALEDEGMPIEEEDTKQVVAFKVAKLAEKNYKVGRVKVATAIYNKYKAEFAKYGI